MRISQGRFKRRYVYDVRLGTRAVRAVYYGGQKIWPTLNDLAERVTLAAPQGIEGAYWQHAIGVLQGEYELLSSFFEKAGVPIAHCCVAGKWFNLELRDAACPAYPLAKYDSGTLVLGANGVPVSAVSVGDEVLIQVKIPKHYTKSFKSPSEDEGISQRWYTRWLPGTRFVYTHYKGQKKVNAWAGGKVVGEKSRQTYFDSPLHQHGGDFRGDTGFHWCNHVDGLKPDYDEEVFLVNMQVGGCSAISLCRMAFPAFTRTFRFRITDIVRHG